MFKQKIMAILRKLLKIVAVLLSIALVIYLGFNLFISIYFKPHDVRLTNVTDTSFAVSWITNYPMKGIVYYKDKDNILPGFLSWIGTKKAYDDRDIASAEKECVEKFNKEAKVSEDFVVDTSKYGCNEVKVKKVGEYFVHHVTLTDLEPNKEYHFRIGDGIFSRKMDMNKSATFLPLSGEVKAPAPIFGKIVNDKGEYVNDSVVYIKFINGYLQKESMYYSSVTSSDGSWYLDGNNIRTIEGEPIIVEDKQDMIKVYAQYQNYMLSDANDWVYGNGDFAYPDIVVSDTWQKDLSMSPTVDNDHYTGWVKKVEAARKGGSVAPKNNNNVTPLILKGLANIVSKFKTITSHRPSHTGVADRPATTPVNPQSNPPAESQDQTLDKVKGRAKEIKAEKEMVNNASTVGYGNVNDKLLSSGSVEDSIQALMKMGLAGGWDGKSPLTQQQAIIIAGNLSAMAGKNNGITADQLLKNDPRLHTYTTRTGTPITSELKTGSISNIEAKTCIGNGCHTLDNNVCSCDKLKTTCSDGETLWNGKCTENKNIPEYKLACARSGGKMNGNICIQESVSTKRKTQATKCFEAGGYWNGSKCLYGYNSDSINVAKISVEEIDGRTQYFYYEPKSKQKLSITVDGGALPDKCLTKTECYITLSYSQIKKPEVLLKSETFPSSGKLLMINYLSKIHGLNDVPRLLLFNRNNTEVFNALLEGIKEQEGFVTENGYHIHIPKNGIPYITDSHGQYPSILDEKINWCYEVAGLLGYGDNGGCKDIDTIAKLEESLYRKYKKDKNISDSRENMDQYFCGKSNGEFFNCTNQNGIINRFAKDENSDIDLIKRLSNNQECSTGECIYSCQEGVLESCTSTITSLGSTIPMSVTFDQVNGTFTIENSEIQKSSKDFESLEKSNKLNTLIKTFLGDEGKGKAYYSSTFGGYDAVPIPLSFMETDWLQEIIDKNGYDEETRKMIQAEINSRLEDKKGEAQDTTDTPSEGQESGEAQGITDTTVLGTTDNTSNNSNSNNSNNSSNTNTLGSGYITYLPEYGFFDMEIAGLKETDKVEGNTLRIFYVETNGIEGFQMPADPDNPKETEDIMLKSSSLNISYKKSAEVMTLNLKRGINLVSFNYIPKIENNEYSKASNMLKWLVSKGAKVEHISYFSGGRWKGIGYVGGQTTGDDFNITPGKGYLVYTEADATVSIPGYRITSSVPVPLSAGWNLVGIHGYSQMYTARSFIDSINSVEGLTANNVSWWPTSKGKYEGLQVVDGKQYGFDFSLSSSNGYFVRISKFSPKDSKCKSLLWHAGGSHNGACGGSK